MDVQQCCSRAFYAYNGQCGQATLKKKKKMLKTLVWTEIILNFYIYIYIYIRIIVNVKKALFGVNDSMKNLHGTFPFHKRFFIVEKVYFDFFTLRENNYY